MRVLLRNPRLAPHLAVFVAVCTASVSVESRVLLSESGVVLTGL